jgi:DNA gyrase/topoisomerase IV subunit A
MINKEDPSEWLAQIELTPASAPVIVRTLLSRVKSLDEYNEELRNENIVLREKIDTKAHQKEVEELRRQLRALGRLAKDFVLDQAMNDIVIAWSDKGFVFALELEQLKVGELILIPYSNKLSTQRIRLLSVSSDDDVLYLTNTGRVGIFEVQPLLNISRENRVWQKLPDLKLGEKEFIALMLPIGMLPFSESLITLSVMGYARGIHKLMINQFLQNAQFGTGVKDVRDVQAFACLIFDKKADVLIFTSQGNYLRFASASIGPPVVQALKTDFLDDVIGIVPSDPSRSQVLVIDANGQAARRSIGDFPTRTIGVKPQPAFSAEEIVAVQAVKETDQVVILAGEEQMHLSIIAAQQVPINNKARSLAQLPGLKDRVHDFVSVQSGKGQ